jgi:hypothetical protein
MNLCFHLRPALPGAANVGVADSQAGIFSRARVIRAALSGVVFCSAFLAIAGARAADLRIGVIGIDSSHSGKFAEAFNGTDASKRIAGARLTLGFKGGSPDMERSRSRVEKFSAELRDTYGVKLVDSLEEIAAGSDAIMILSVDGRAHLPEARAVFGKGKPVFIDKPFGGSLADSIALVKLARETNTRVYSCSNYRFATGLTKIKTALPGRLRLAEAYGPATLEPLMPDFYFYIVHVTESLYTLLGPGCESVARTSTKECEVATGVWQDGRIGVVYGLKGSRVGNGATAFGAKSVASEVLETNFPALATTLVAFFRGADSPVRLEETLEIMAFMEAADESKRRGGAPVKLADVMAKAGGDSSLLRATQQ